MFNDAANFNLFLSLIRFKWTSFGLYAIASVMSVSLRLKGLTLREEFFAASIGMGILITGATALLLILGFWVIRPIRVRWHWVVIPMLLLAGGVRGAILNLEIDGFGYENRISLWASILSSTFYTAIYYSGASLFIELKNRRKNQFQAEFQRATLLRLGSEEFSSSTDLQGEYQKSMEEIKTAIKLHLPVHESQLLDSAQATKVAAEIREQVQMVIRPLSHRLWIGSMGEIKTSSGRRVLSDTLQELDFSTRFILLYQFSVGLFGIGISIGFVDGMLKTIPAILGTYLCILLLGLLRNINFIQWQLRTTIFLLSLTFVPITFSELFSGLINREVNWLAALVIAPTLPVVVVITSLITLVARDRKFAIAAVQSVAVKLMNAGSDFSDEISELELSGYLHNNLQSELLRIASQLDLTSDSPGQESSKQLIGDLHQALGRSMTDVQSLQSSGLDRIKALPKAWEGIAEIKLILNLQVPCATEKERALCGFLEEAITNSIRYGGASKLTISVQTGQVTKVSVEHNGDGSIHIGTGLGAIWLAQIAVGAPKINKKRGVTTIEFSL